ncbi:hypothetical protein POM88_005183 [Heracleum sosnowskyi]|uniref:Rho-GAP domain-containing protein n=1 Tax=Heracleum sosnowskyi TaxID=360622 RepID=A0AAD8JKT2_9APIA|nr:hypothetical protein POM88_005183 [Heracleum sosnowskyi]
MTGVSGMRGTDRSKRTDAMRSAIYEKFPDPNRRLLQRILAMMQIVVSHEDVNHMNTSAVAACMAPLLLRPLGDGELQNNFKMGGDSSAQLLQAAVAANHAKSIVITLLEEYDKNFGLHALGRYLVFCKIMDIHLELFLSLSCFFPSTRLDVSEGGTRKLYESFSSIAERAASDQNVRKSKGERAEMRST